MQKYFHIDSYFVILCSVLSLLFWPAVCVAVAVERGGNQSLPTLRQLYKFAATQEELRTKNGALRTYTIYLPKASPDLPGPPYPFVVLLHGFFQSSDQQSHNAEFLAEHGFVVLTPNLTRILYGSRSHVENVEDIMLELNSLLRKSDSPGNMLSGMIDAHRLALVGHSAGGAACLEVLLQAQMNNVPISSVCLLDGTPWSETRSHMAQIKPVKILSLKSEPSFCNQYGNVSDFLRLLKFPYQDIKIIGSHHCDGENPTNPICICVCGPSDDEHRHLFQMLMYTYLADTMKAPHFLPVQDFTQYAQELANRGKITRP